MTTPFDPGLQPERTLLAWRRTCLALGLGSVVAVRFTVAEFGVLGIVLGALGAVLAIAAYFAAALRYRRMHGELSAASDLSSGGRALALLTATILVLGIASVAYVVGHGVMR